MLNMKRMRFPMDIVLTCIRWYAAYPLSYRHLEEWNGRLPLDAISARMPSYPLRRSLLH